MKEDVSEGGPMRSKINRGDAAEIFAKSFCCSKGWLEEKVGVEDEGWKRR